MRRRFESCRGRLLGRQPVCSCAAQTGTSARRAQAASRCLRGEGAKLLLNGCERSALSPEAFWPVVQHFTVAELRAAFGIDTPVGLEAAMTCAFPGITVTYEQQP